MSDNVQIPMIRRLGRDARMLEIAKTIGDVSGTCPRARVGAIVFNFGIVATGYNGSPAGLPHCDEVGCLMYHEHCIRTIHAEVNAIIQAGHSARGADLYSTHLPCLECAKVIINAGIARVVVNRLFIDDRSDLWGRTAIDMLREAGVIVNYLLADGEDGLV